MKKLLLLLLAFPILFGSCSKDDDDSAPSLKSTVWEGKEAGINVTLTFSELESTLVLSASGVSKSASYSYTYEHPVVTMHPKDSENATMKGTVSSDYKSMVLVNTSTEKTVASLSKK